MAAEDVTKTRIEMLRRRWELAVSPHVSLQLADLYRQAGELPQAIAVLERGLEGNPASVSLRVALGRYRMESGDHQGATVALREVVDRDPSHLVANKLLVRSYLLQGERQKARDRLDLYTLLNDSDPEIATLERSVASGHLQAEPARPPRPAPAAPFDLPTPTTTVDLADLPAPPRPVHPAPAAPVLRHIWFASSEEPFAGLAAARTDPRDWSYLLEEGIFQAPAAPRAPAVNGVSLPMPGAGTASTTSAVAELEAPAAPPVGPPAPVSEAPATAPEPEVSATLGRLYLDQGHLAEAEAIFSALLARESDHPGAQAAMFEIAARRALGAEPAPAGLPPAMEVAAEVPPALPIPAPPAVASAPSIVERKIGVLRDYLARLRRGRGLEGTNP